MKIIEINYFEGGKGYREKEYNNQMHNQENSPTFQKLYPELGIERVLKGKRESINKTVLDASFSALNNKEPLIFLGGDDGFTQPILNAISFFHKKLSILNVDMHADNSADYNEFPFASWYYNLNNLFNEYEVKAYPGIWSDNTKNQIEFDRLENLEQFKPQHKTFLNLDVDSLADDLNPLGKTTTWVHSNYITEEFGLPNFSEIFSTLKKIKEKKNIIPLLQLSETRPGTIDKTIKEEVKTEIFNVVNQFQKLI